MELRKLNDQKLFEIAGIRGVSEASAIYSVGTPVLTRKQSQKIMAFKEIINRAEFAKKSKNPPIIKSSLDVYDMVKHILNDLEHEAFAIVIISQSLRVLGVEIISSGGLAGTVVDLPIVFRKLLEYTTASGFFAVHNHPSGSLSPSTADKSLTARMTEAAKTLGYVMPDHLIVAKDNGYFSFADEGII